MLATSAYDSGCHSFKRAANFDMRTKEAIRADIEATSARLAKLKFELQQAEAGHSEILHDKGTGSQKESETVGRWPLPADDYKRYGRQMIMPEIGLQGILICDASSERRLAD